MQTKPQSSSGLALGMVLGLVAAIVSVLTPEWQLEPNVQVVASVNGTPITREKYLSHLQALSTDKKDPITKADSHYVLERIIEEELLVQRGLEVGLLDSDKRTRAAMVNAMISMTTATAEATEPSLEQLNEFLADNIDYFTSSARLRVRQILIGGAQAAANAKHAYQLLQTGMPFDTVAKRFGKTAALSLPNTLLPPTKLREYVGPAMAQQLQQAEAGFISKPQPSGPDYRLLVLMEKAEGQRPLLADIRPQVEAEYVRRSGDRSLREYLEWLKDRAEISYPSELPL